MYSTMSFYISWILIVCIHSNGRVKLRYKERGYCSSVASVCTQNDKWDGGIKPGMFLSIYAWLLRSASIPIDVSLNGGRKHRFKMQMRIKFDYVYP